MKELSHITEQREDRSTARPETKRIIPPSEARADTRKQWRTSRRLEQRRTYLSRSGLSQKKWAWWRCIRITTLPLLVSAQRLETIAFY